jgi:hypothetical protein
MASPLEDMSGVSKTLAAERPDAREFAGLKRSALMRLKDAEKPVNCLESRFDLAYNAAHALSLAALRWHGYRPSKRQIVFQVLPHTLGLGPEVCSVLLKCHDIRDVGEYQGDFEVDERIVVELIAACKAVAAKLGDLGSPQADGA